MWVRTLHEGVSEQPSVGEEGDGEWRKNENCGNIDILWTAPKSLNSSTVLASRLQDRYLFTIIYNCVGSRFRELNKKARNSAVKQIRRSFAMPCRKSNSRSKWYTIAKLEVERQAIKPRFKSVGLPTRTSRVGPPTDRFWKVLAKWPQVTCVQIGIKINQPFCFPTHTHTHTHTHTCKRKRKTKAKTTKNTLSLQRISWAKVLCKSVGRAIELDRWPEEEECSFLWTHLNLTPFFGPRFLEIWL